MRRKVEKRSVQIWPVIAMTLYSPRYFESLFEPLIGKRIGFFLLDGNVGDCMSRQATRELFDYFNITFEDVLPWRVDSQSWELDELVISGGGNMGSNFYRRPFEERIIARQMGLPITVFPQTFIADAEDLSAFTRIFVREKQSLSLRESFELAPDLAMGLGNVPWSSIPELPLGVFLREDIEARFPGHSLSLGDPASLSATPEEYLELAARFEHIITDRLHFAIAALLQNRRVTLLPNSYWKNHAVFHTWLRDFDCSWLDEPESIKFDARAVADSMLHRLAGPPSRIINWACRPVRQSDHKLYPHSDRSVIRRVDGPLVAWCDGHTQIIWSLCDGEQTVAEMLDTLRELYPDDSCAISRDLQSALQFLLNKNAIYLDEASSGDDSNSAGSPVWNKSKLAPLEIVVRPAEFDGNKTTLSAVLSDRENLSSTLWFKIDNRHKDLLTQHADPYVLVLLMHAMRSGRDIVVKGAPISRGLLGNLERFQLVWNRWRSTLKHIDILAEEDPDREPEAKDGALLAFSGGVDSCFTVYEYTHRCHVRHQPRPTAALMIYGFDIKCADEFDAVFTRAAQRSRKILDSVDLSLITMDTNAKTFIQNNWLDEHGLLLSAALHLFREGFNSGVIPSTMPYEMLMPLGSNPITDPLTSSRSFEIIHHGAHADRMDKLETVGRWLAAQENLRVCWSGPDPDRNCGYCAKCVLTHLGLWAQGLEAPCFQNALTADVVRAIMGDTPLAPLDWLQVWGILIKAKENGLEAPWIPILQYKLSVKM